LDPAEGFVEKIEDDTGKHEEDEKTPEVGSCG
jgi:hypothetical protein